MSKEPKYTDAQRQQIMDWRRQIPAKHNESYRKAYDTAMARKSMRLAVKSKCLDCMGWVKKEVQNCDILSCSLWCYRPYQKRVKDTCGINSGAHTIAPVLSGETNALFAACGTGQEKTE